MKNNDKIDRWFDNLNESIEQWKDIHEPEIVLVMALVLVISGII